MDTMLERICELIGKKHGAKKELAYALGINQNIITSWLSERTKTYKDYAPQIARYYGVSLDWLSGASDIKNAPAAPEDDERIKEAMKIYELYQQVPDDKKEAAVAMLRGLIDK